MSRKILIIGPSINHSKGGMATVIEGIVTDSKLNSKHSIDAHESYSDGNIIYRIIFSIIAYIRFIFIYNKYDIFYIHMASYGSTFRKGFYIRFLNKRNKRIILHVHGAEYIMFYNSLSESKKRKIENIWEKSEVIIALSEKWKIKFESIFRHKNIIVINNGIDIEQYKDAICFLDEARNKFLFLGRIGIRKGAYDIVSAVENLSKIYPDILVYMAGDGEINQIKNLIKEKKLDNNIEVIGWINFKNKIELLKKVSTVLLPSYNEGLPMSILEGMASGKAIISTDVGGIPELVENNINGLVISPGDISALSKAISKMIEDEKFVKRCSINNLEKIEFNFSRKKMHEKISAIFNNI